MPRTSVYETIILRLCSSHRSLTVPQRRFKRWRQCCTIHSVTAKPLLKEVFVTVALDFLTPVQHSIMIILLLAAGPQTEEQNGTPVAALWIIKLLSFKAISSC